MAGIKATIELIDRITAPLQRIQANLQRTSNTMNNASVASNKLENSFNGNKAASEVKKPAREVKRLGNNAEEAKNKVDSLHSVLGTLKKTIIGLGIGKTVGKLIEQSDSITMNMARLNQMNDGLQTTDELFDRVFEAAQRSRGSVDDMMSVVARFGNNAREAFSSSQEVIDFAEIVQKQMIIAGASTQEASNAMLQLSQGLGSGVLRGDELNSVFEQAPNLIRSIAEYLNVPIGQIRTMASEGQITADIVKNAIFASGEKVNALFNKMPMTWGQVNQRMQNEAINSMKPVLAKVNELANNEAFQKFSRMVLSAVSTFSIGTLQILQVLSDIAQFCKENWQIVSPALAVAGVAVLLLAAHLAYLRVMLIKTAVTKFWTDKIMGINPMVGYALGILAVIAALGALCGWIAKTTGVAKSALGVVVGAVYWCAAVIYNVVIGLLNALIQLFWTIFVLPFLNIVEYILNVTQGGFDSFGDAVAKLIGNIIGWWLSLGKVVTTIIDAIFGTNWTAGLQQLQNSVQSWGKSDKTITLKKEAPVIQRMDYGDAFGKGAAVGDAWTDKIGNMFDFSKDGNGVNLPDPTKGNSQANTLNDIANNTANTAKGVAAMGDSIDMSNANLQYMRDVAEQEAINRYTTAEIKVDMTNNNSIKNGMDIDSIIKHLSNGVQNAMMEVAGGVHV